MKSQLMRIRVTGQSGEPVFPFSESGPWKAFENILKLNKYQMQKGNFGEKIDGLICNGFSSDAIKEAKASGLPKNKMILVLWEPPIINPKAYLKKYTDHFGVIYSPSKKWLKGNNVYYFKYPVDKIKAYQTRNFKTRLNNPIVMQNNKINFFVGEKYSLRRSVLFESLLLHYPIFLYGGGWNRVPIPEALKAFIRYTQFRKHGLSRNCLAHIFSKYPYYKGVALNKNRKLSEHKICVVIENHNSYVSEKLFDALNAGCLTVYIGPKLSDFGLSSNIAIQISSSSNSIIKVLRKLSILDDSNLLKIVAIQQKHFRNDFKDWQNNFVLSNLASSISTDLNK